MDHRESTGSVRQTAAFVVLASALLLVAAPLAGAATSATSVTISATVPGTPPENGTGGGSAGGGGGGGGSVPEGKATVVFSGRAYPGSIVTVLQSGSRRGTTVAGSDATFSFTLEKVAAGSHTFALYSTDRKGVRSAVQTYPLRVTPNLITTVSGIFIAPTISVNKSVVQKGEPITILGQTTPSGAVLITVNSIRQLNFSTTADGSGLYAYTFLTSPLEEGRHEAQSRTSLNGAVSSPSSVATFRVGTGNAASGTDGGQGDLNGDGQINLVDFSIAAFWFKKPSPPARYDINGDGAVTIIDFSIMAYHWTG